MSSITYDEFLERVEKYHKEFDNSWRFGQTYFNTLSSVRRDVAEQLRSTLHDPFHKDEVPTETHKFVKSLW